MMIWTGDDVKHGRLPLRVDRGTLEDYEQLGPDFGQNLWGPFDEPCLFWAQIRISANSH